MRHLLALLALLLVVATVNAGGGRHGGGGHGGGGFKGNKDTFREQKKIVSAAIVFHK